MNMCGECRHFVHLFPVGNPRRGWGTCYKQNLAPDWKNLYLCSIPEALGMIYQDNPVVGALLECFEAAQARTGA